MRRLLAPLALLLPALGCTRGPAPVAAPPVAAVPVAGAERPVKLAVLVVFDQMRGDYVERWQDLYGDGGFKRLRTEGAWYPACYYPYGVTTTGPGHASILSGCGAETHGIINNTWYDRGEAKAVYCAATGRYEFVPAKPPPAVAPADSGKDVRKARQALPGDPTRMLSPTVGDQVKAATDGRGKVVGVSLKDRSAVLPVGKKPDGAYWFDGRFVTSTYYRDALPAWVAAFNASGKAEAYFGKPWEKLRPDLDYARFSGPDDAAGEGKGDKQGTTFPHPTTGGLTAPGPEFYEALANSPYGNELLLDFAKACVEAEQLGQDDVPDLLTVSFSSNDLIGHTWGPDSQEVLDVTLRSDRILADLLTYLDAKVGKGNYTFVVTADHGVGPLPEQSGGERISALALLGSGVRFLEAAYGGPGKTTKGWVAAVEAPYVYLNRPLIEQQGANPDEVAEKLAAWVRTEHGVQAAYTRQQLLDGVPSDPVAAIMRKSFYPDRAGDLVVVSKPHSLFGWTGETGTSHGTPHEYDRHAVFFAYGPGIGGGRRAEPITPLHAAAIVARVLGVPRPKDAWYDVPASLAR